MQTKRSLLCSRSLRQCDKYLLLCRLQLHNGRLWDLLREEWLYCVLPRIPPVQLRRLNRKDKLQKLFRQYPGLHEVFDGIQLSCLRVRIQDHERFVLQQGRNLSRWDKQLNNRNLRFVDHFDYIRRNGSAIDGTCGQEEIHWLSKTRAFDRKLRHMR